MDIVKAQKWAYTEDPPEDLSPIRELLHKYSDTPVEDVERHVVDIREELWAISRFPCVGRWKFLRLIDSRDPLYRHILFRLRLPRSRDVLLDLGCCVAQVLRQLRADGVNGSQLIGTDLEPEFIEIGYSLFRDRERLGAHFVVGDMLDPDDHRLAELHGKVTIVHAGSFFHLFTWTQQVYIGKRLVDFLKPGTRNALIFGKQAGISRSGEPGVVGSSAYIHDKDSFQRLWDEVGALTRTKWVVEMDATGDIDADLPELGKDVQPVEFAIHQIA